MKYAVGFLLGLLSTAAVAETAIYGEIKGGVNTIHQTGIPATYDASVNPAANRHHEQTQVDDYGSFVGLRGKEQLGDSSIKAIWQIEQDTPLTRQSRHHH